ncbi:hypothetical protein ACS3SW_03955 [Roseobacteraceae bacterium S113]
MTLKSTLFALPLALAPLGAFAAGGDDTAPKTTNTTQTCATGLVWDADRGACVAPQDSRLDDDTRYEAVRELAYHGALDAAQAVLASMSDQSEPRVQTYWGFTHARMGDLDAGLRHYQAALKSDPSNILARSYMGQALLANGQRGAAFKQYRAILELGGKGSWAEASLRDALETGRTYNY